MDEGGDHASVWFNNAHYALTADSGHVLSFNELDTCSDGQARMIPQGRGECVSAIHYAFFYQLSEHVKISVKRKFFRSLNILRTLAKRYPTKVYRKAAKAHPTNPANDPNLKSTPPATAAEELLLDPALDVADAMTDETMPPILLVVGVGVPVAAMTKTAEELGSTSSAGLQPPV
jgi:hypothetical protein